MTTNSEGGRIARLLENAQRCSIEENLARARAYQGTDSCIPCKSYNYLGNKDVPSESSYLTLRPKCFTYVREPVVPESIRIGRIQQSVLNNEIDPMNPNTRFSDYAPTPTIVGCPPITYSNGTVPQRCPLPNTPLNSALQ